MYSPYPGKEIKSVSDFDGSPSCSTYSVDDVVGSFDALPSYADYLGFYENNLFIDDAYTGIHNHFQGVQRLKNGKHFIISGGNIKDQHGHLFILGLDDTITRLSDKTGPVGTNLGRNNLVPDNDKLKDVLCLETGNYWHAGGISLMGDILAVPLENRKENRSVITFYNFKNISRVQRLRKFIVRRSGKAGAVAITMLNNGYFLCAVWSDDDSLAKRFDFYLSKNKSDLKSFKKIKTITISEILKGDSFPKFQSIQFIKQSDGKIFLIGTYNTNKLAPRLKGTNKAILFSLDIDPKYYASKRKNPYPSLHFVSERSFAKGNDYYNFGAACGIYVDKQKELALYSAYHWRQDGQIRLGEFYSQQRWLTQSVKHKKDVFIELYEDKRFSKRCLRLYGHFSCAIKQYQDYYVQGDTFDDKVSSIRYRLPKGMKYRLYDDSNYNRTANGKLKKDKNHLTLIGTGRIESIPDLDNHEILNLKFKRDFNDRISSSRFVK